MPALYASNANTSTIGVLIYFGALCSFTLPPKQNASNVYLTKRRTRNETMTNAQQKKLDTIIGKLEALQNSISKPTQKESDAMREAKSRLLSILQT